MHGKILEGKNMLTIKLTDNPPTQEEIDTEKSFLKSSLQKNQKNFFYMLSPSSQ